MRAGSHGLSRDDLESSVGEIRLERDDERDVEVARELDARSR